MLAGKPALATVELQGLRERHLRRPGNGQAERSKVAGGQTEMTRLVETGHQRAHLGQTLNLHGRHLVASFVQRYVAECRLAGRCHERYLTRRRSAGVKPPYQPVVPAPPLNGPTI